MEDSNSPKSHSADTPLNAKDVGALETETAKQDQSASRGFFKRRLNNFFFKASDRFAFERWGFFVILIVLVLIGLRVYVRDKQQTYGGLLRRPLRVGIVSWPGYAGGLVANHGLKPNKESIRRICRHKQR
jgi:hypothetical protein